MTRPVTLFTGQWADLSFEKLLPQIAEMGYDGVELACWGDHFDVQQALQSDPYCQDRWAALLDNGLTCYAVSNHLVGQAVCDRIDARHQSVVPGHVWGDGDAEGVRQRAAREMIDTAKAYRRFLSNKPASAPAQVVAPVVNGFTGSSIWHLLYSFPPATPAMIQAGYDDFAKRWIPILDAFEAVDVNFALEVHPTEIAFDTASAKRALNAVGQHKRFGFNYDPSHFGYQGVDYVAFIRSFPDRIFHVHVKDAWWGHGDGSVGVFGGHTDFGDWRRYWDFRSPGHGDIEFEDIIVALNDIRYEGPLSVEWEDIRMDRFHGAAEAADFVHSIDFPPSNVAFDAAFDKSRQ